MIFFTRLRITCKRVGLIIHYISCRELVQIIVRNFISRGRGFPILGQSWNKREKSGRLKSCLMRGEGQRAPKDANATFKNSQLTKWLTRFPITFFNICHRLQGRRIIVNVHKDDQYACWNCASRCRSHSFFHLSRKINLRKTFYVVSPRLFRTANRNGIRNLAICPKTSRNIFYHWWVLLLHT